MSNVESQLKTNNVSDKKLEKEKQILSDFIVVITKIRGLTAKQTRGKYGLDQKTVEHVEKQAESRYIYINIYIYFSFL